MNILYIIHNTDIENGATVAFVNLLKGLIKKGIKPIVAAPDNKGIYNILKSKGIDVINVPFSMSIYPRHTTIKSLLIFIPRLIVWPILWLNAVRKITDYVKKKEVNIVHSNVSVINVGYLCAKKLNVPHIYHVREYMEDLGYKFFPNRKTFFNWIKSKKNYTIFITRALQKFYSMQGNEHSIVSYDGIDKPTKPLQICKKENYFLFVGRVQAIKGVDLILKSYSTYIKNSKNPISLYIAGSLDDRHYFEKQKKFIGSHKLEKFVHFLGKRNDIDSLMSHAKALIISSRSEGFGLTFSEAAKNGCLIIGRYNTGIKEQIDNGQKLENGDIALSFTTKQQLTQLLIDIEKIPAINYDHYIKRAYDAICSDLYDQQLNVDKVYSFYKYIIKNNNK